MQATSYLYDNMPTMDEADWASTLDSANDQVRPVWGSRDMRSPCQNAACDQLCVSVFCSEICRAAWEGPDHEDALEDAPQGFLEPLRGTDAAPLPEARASVNVRLSLHGHDCQVTLRDHDETVLLDRLEALLARFPMAPPSPSQPQTPGKDWCALHQVAMRLNEKEGRTWYSHKTIDGWCKGKAVRHD